MTITLSCGYGRICRKFLLSTWVLIFFFSSNSVFFPFQYYAQNNINFVHDMDHYAGCLAEQERICNNFIGIRFNRSIRSSSKSIRGRSIVQFYLQRIQSRHDILVTNFNNKTIYQWQITTYIPSFCSDLGDNWLPDTYLLWAKWSTMNINSAILGGMVYKFNCCSYHHSE